ncbi:MAG TPA: type VI secretion system baseplate subunit TssG [Planctomycetaceae bacterium]|jgi:type VI secretion system protein ImpH
MAEAGRQPGAALSDQLFREPWRFEFFQAVRLLEWLAWERAQAGAESRAPVGHDERPQHECVRFRVPPSRGFPASEIASLVETTPDAAPEMEVNFLGLVGPSGVLPQHYTELVIQRLRRYKDSALRDFLDLFHHRAVSLFYRAWEKYRFPVVYERTARSREPVKREQEHLDFTWHLHCLVGQGTAGLRGRLEINDEAFLYYAGHFSHRPRSAVVLKTMLADFFDMPVEIRQFQGQWLYLRAPDQTRMPAPGLPLGLNARLGLDTIVGDRVWNVESKFRVRLGPLGYREFHDLMPGGRSLRALCQFVRRYVGHEFDFDVQVVLKKEEVPQSQLGAADSPTRLGWNSWLCSRPPDQDAPDAVFASSE